MSGINYFDENDKKPKNAVPMIVAYVPFIPKAKIDAILQPMIQAIIERFKVKSKELELDIKPRFNRKIKDFIWIAGGDGDDKGPYKSEIEVRKLPRSNVYTDDYAFFKGYEV